ncbi:MAG: DnaD domain protein [Lactobacillaceae bacterium]
MGEKPSYYAILTADIRYDKRLKPNEKLMYSEITALTNKEGYCHASNKYFAELYDVVPQTVSKWISHLEQLGYVTVELIRRDNQIVQRKIQLPVNTPSIKSEEGINKKVKNPINKKVKGNNTSINNKKEIKEKVDVLPIQKLSDYYQHNIGVIRPLILEDMRAYLDDFIEQGTDSEEAAKIIKLAIKIAVDNNKPSWSYASACLRNWTNESLFALESIKAAREQHQTARQQVDGNRYSRKPQVEAVTDWDKKQAKPVDPNELAKLQEEWERYKNEQSKQKWQT